MSLELYYVPQNMVPQVWPVISPIIEKALDWRYTPEDILEALLAGDQTAWAVEKDGEVIAAATTEILEYPTGKIARFVSIAGDDMNSWLKFGPKLEGWAVQNGCVGFELIGRPGWSRIMKNHGYTKTHEILEKRF